MSGGAPGATARVQRSARVREELEEAIRRGELAPGERLPSERELVAAFGVSRVSVREALHSLETLGIVRVEHGRGAFVSERRSELAEPLARWLLRHRDEVIDLYAVRGVLEELAAQRGAERQDAGALARLGSAHAALRAAVEAGADAEELRALDVDFHVAIAESSGNRLLCDLLIDHHTYLGHTRGIAFSTPVRPPQSVAEHARIVQAIGRGDPGAARRAMRRHGEAIRGIVADVLAASGQPGDG